MGENVGDNNDNMEREKYACMRDAVASVGRF
jgi:hypothetical protein